MRNFAIDVRVPALDEARKRIEALTGQQVASVSLSYPLMKALERELSETQRFAPVRHVRERLCIIVEGLPYRCERFLGGERVVWFNAAGDILDCQVGQ